MSKTITISDDTYDLIKDQLTQNERIDLSCVDDLIGKKLFIRTVTYHFIGEVVKIFGSFVQLKNTIWVADSGRFMQAIKDGELNEYEEIGDWFVNLLSATTDFGEWKHKIPKGQK
jgi:hypothetical protein